MQGTNPAPHQDDTRRNPICIMKNIETNSWMYVIICQECQNVTMIENWVKPITRREEDTWLEATIGEGYTTKQACRRCRNGRLTDILTPEGCLRTPSIGEDQ